MTLTQFSTQKMSDTYNRQITVPSWLEEWAGRKINAISKTSHSVFKSYIRRLKEAFSGILLCDLNLETVQEKANELLAKGLSPLTLHGMFSYFFQACQAAYRKHLIDHNPCIALHLPAQHRRIREGISDDEFHRLLECAEGTDIQNMIAVKGYAALRTGEVFGLSWDNVDFANHLLTISQQYVYYDDENNKRTGHLIKQVKAGSIRIINPPEETFDCLRKEKEHQDASRIANESKWDNPHNLVFTRKNGNSMRRVNGVPEFTKIKIDAGLPWITLHDLRHYGAALKYETSGHDLWAVKDYLGHRQLKMTINYLYATMQQMKDDADKIDNIYSQYIKDY